MAMSRRRSSSEVRTPKASSRSRARIVLTLVVASCFLLLGLQGLTSLFIYWWYESSDQMSKLRNAVGDDVVVVLDDVAPGLGKGRFVGIARLQQVRYEFNDSLGMFDLRVVVESRDHSQANAEYPTTNASFMLRPWELWRIQTVERPLEGQSRAQLELLAEVWMLTTPRVDASEASVAQ